MEKASNGALRVSGAERGRCGWCDIIRLAFLLDEERCPKADKEASRAWLMPALCTAPYYSWPG